MDARPGFSHTLRVLGGFELRAADGRDLTPPGKKLRALIAFLAVTPGKACSRERLATLLWGDRTEEHARGNLRQALCEIRCIVGKNALKSDRATVTFDPAALTVDASEFERLAETGELGLAADLYRGSLLNGVSMPDAEFAEWLLVERTRMHDLAINILSRLLRTQRGEAAIATAQRLLDLDPLREETHCTLMHLHASQGDRAKALRQYQICRDTLRRELGILPDARTERLYRSVQEKGTAEPTALPAEELARASYTQHCPSKPSIAVLPFANLSGNPELECFSHGFTEDITTELSRCHELSVVGYNASSQFREKPIDAKKVGRDLGVQYIVLGSVRTLSDQIRITVRLVDATSGAHLWGERFDRSQQEVLTAPDLVVRILVGTLMGRLDAADMERARRKEPMSFVAHDYVMRGLSLPVGDVVVEAQARRMYEKAVDLDPTFPLAHTMLAYALWLKWFRDMTESNIALDQALEAAKKAVQLDDTNSECVDMLAWIYLQRRDFDLAEQHYRRGLDLNPNNPICACGMGDWLIFVGRPDEGLAWYQQAKLLNPHFNLPWWWNMCGVAHFNARRYDKALAAFRRSPNSPFWVRTYMAACNALQDNARRARVYAGEVLLLVPDFSLTRFAAKEPYKRQADREHLIKALREARLPE